MIMTVLSKLENRNPVIQKSIVETLSVLVNYSKEKFTKENFK